MLAKVSRLCALTDEMGFILETMSLTKQKTFQGSSPVELAVLKTLITSRKSSVRTGFSHAVSCLLSRQETCCCVRERVQPLTLRPRLFSEPSSKAVCLFVF